MDDCVSRDRLDEASTPSLQTRHQNSRPLATFEMRYKCACSEFLVGRLDFFDRQFFPLAAQVKQSQNVVEDHQQVSFGGPGSNGKMGKTNGTGSRLGVRGPTGKFRVYS